MDAFEKWWTETQPHNYIPSSIHRDAFRAGMRAAALIVADHAPDTRPQSPCNLAVIAILAEADK